MHDSTTFQRCDVQTRNMSCSGRNMIHCRVAVAVLVFRSLSWLRCPPPPTNTHSTRAPFSICSIWSQFGVYRNAVFCDGFGCQCHAICDCCALEKGYDVFFSTACINSRTKPNHRFCCLLSLAQWFTIASFYRKPPSPNNDVFCNQYKLKLLYNWRVQKTKSSNTRSIISFDLKVTHNLTHVPNPDPRFGFHARISWEWGVVEYRPSSVRATWIK